MTLQSNLKVMIVVDDTLTSATEYKTNGNKYYKGLNIDIWNKIKQKLGNKYTYDEFYVEESDNDKLIREVAAGKYDIIIGFFQKTLERSKMVNFTNNILLNKDAILQYPDITLFTRIKIIFKDLLFGPIIILIILGLIFGFILHYIEPHRYKKSRASKELNLRRSVLTTIAALFGEMGFLAENSTLGIWGIIITVVMILFSFFALMILQSETTTKVIDLKNQDLLSRTSIPTRHFLAIKGSAIGQNIERFGAKITYKDFKTLKEVVEFYKKNKNKYDGVVMSYLNATGFAYFDPELNISNVNIGYIEQGFIINKTKTQLLTDIDDIILEMQNRLEIETICKGYFHKAEDAFLCIL